tara:strand:- start:1277 stop:1693 length:417 start_codon:yes stop_codon:yes gene_type:complete
MYIIVIKKFFEGGEMWVNEDYTTTEEDKNEDLLAYGEIFGHENVRLVSKEEWEMEHTSLVQTDRRNDVKEDAKDIRELQDKEYRKCLREDRKREKQIKEDEKKNHPSLKELRKLRLKHFDYSARRMTRSSTKKLCKKM